MRHTYSKVDIQTGKMTNYETIPQTQMKFWIDQTPDQLDAEINDIFLINISPEDITDIKILPGIRKGCFSVFIFYKRLDECQLE